MLTPREKQYFKYNVSRFGSLPLLGLGFLGLVSLCAGKDVSAPFTAWLVFVVTMFVFGAVGTALFFFGRKINPYAHLSSVNEDVYSERVTAMAARSPSAKIAFAENFSMSLCFGGIIWWVVLVGKYDGRKTTEVEATLDLAALSASWATLEGKAFILLSLTIPVVIITALMTYYRDSPDNMALRDIPSSLINARHQSKRLEKQDGQISLAEEKLASQGDLSRVDRPTCSTHNAERHDEDT